jgi:Cd2+/Zn2+-exporting ATPase
MKKAAFKIHGLDCAEEVSLLRRQLEGSPGVGTLTFDVLHGRMSAEFDPAVVSEHELVRQVAQTGLQAEPWREAGAGPQESFWRRRGKWTLAGVSGVALVGAVLLEGFTTHHLPQLFRPAKMHFHYAPLPVIVLSLVAIVTGIWFSVAKAAAALRLGRFDMNVLVCVSICGACYLGEWTEGGTLAFLFAVANLLESWSVARARQAIGALMKEAPREACVVHGQGDHTHEHRMPVERVPAGSIVRVRPGEKIPFDGEVVKGASGVNQALITGEALPVLKEPGSDVFAGTLNTDGVLEIRTTRIASDTALARIIRMVEESHSRRAPSEQLVERFSRWYTPAMMLVAILVMAMPPLVSGWTWSQAFYQSMVVLLIACPCALVISTPVTIAAALASAARQGVLVKGGAYLEVAAKVRAVAFDKTGVLTRGEPEVTVVEALDGLPPRELIRRLTSVETASEHPLGRAIVRHGESHGVRPPPAEEFVALPGRGAEAVVEGERFWVGSDRYVAERGVSTGTALDRVAELEASGQTVVFCGDDRRLLGLVGLRDTVRPGSRHTVEGLREMGVERIAVLTGDRAAAAQAVGRALQVDDVRAGLLPEEKSAAVEELVAQYGVVAMVGDGVNDAQAMARAPLGVAIGRRSTDVAMETADAVILSEDPQRLVFLVRHAQRSLRVIKQNLAFALGSKLVFLVIALMGSATLWMAIAADMGATLVVTFNGLRMLRSAWRPRT